MATNANVELPNNLSAEQVLLGIVLHDGPEVMPVLSASLKPEDFFNSRHQKLYQICVDLYRQYGDCEVSMVSDYLTSHEIDFDEVGGSEYIGRMMHNALDAKAAKRYHAMVKEAAARREVMRYADEIVRLAADTRRDIGAVVAYGADRLHSSLPKLDRGARSLVEIAAQERERIRHEVTQGISTGFRSGWERLNRVLAPLEPGQLVVIGACPRMGKTAFAVNWALHLATEGHHGVLYSMEMRDAEIGLRAMLNYSRTTNEDLQHPSYIHDGGRADEVMEDMTRAAASLPEGVLVNDDAGMTLGEMRSELTTLTRERSLSWMMVDFLQLAKADKSYRNRAEEVGAMAYELADMAKEFKLVVFALSQFSREVNKESPRRPRMDHFLESGKIEAAAHRLLYLYRPSEYGDREVEAAGYPQGIPQATEVGILKQRSGKSNGKTTLYFDGDHYLFRDLTYAEREAVLDAQKAAKGREGR